MMIQLCGLWKSEKSINGKIDESFPILGGLRLVILKNELKTGKQPDYRAFLSRDDVPQKEQDDTTPF